jgi:hypothetical protein
MKKMPTRIAWIATLGGVGAMAVLAAWWGINRQDDADQQKVSVTDEKKATQPISPAVLALLSEEARPLNDRLDALRLAGFSLPQGDRMALLRSLSEPKRPGLCDDDWFTLANDIMQLLRNQQPAMPEITPALLGLWNDSQQDPTIRDYALQHLREWVSDYDVRSAHETNPTQIKEIQKTFLSAIDLENPNYNPHSTTLGTALLALHEWHQQDHPHAMWRTGVSPVSADGHPARSRPQAEATPSFDQRLIAILADPTVHRGTRATALQIAAQRKMTNALPVARQILNHVESDMILRLAAINFLGSNGSNADKEFLITYQQHHQHDTLLQSSLAKALQTLNTP